jgi:hypothetical protein
VNECIDFPPDLELVTLTGHFPRFRKKSTGQEKLFHGIEMATRHSEIGYWKTLDNCARLEGKRPEVGSSTFHHSKAPGDGVRFGGRPRGLDPTRTGKRPLTLAASAFRRLTRSLQPRFAEPSKRAAGSLKGQISVVLNTPCRSGFRANSSLHVTQARRRRAMNNTPILPSGRTTFIPRQPRLRPSTPV